MENSTVTVEASVPANVGKVWQYYNDPQHIVNWNYASDDWHCPAAENDLRVGGKFRSRMEAKDGSEGFDFEATYDEVVDRRKIAYTMPDGRRATVNFDDLGGETKVTITFDAENEFPVAYQKAGWQAILDNFKNYVADAN